MKLKIAKIEEPICPIYDRILFNYKNIYNLVHPLLLISNESSEEVKEVIKRNQWFYE